MNDPMGIHTPRTHSATHSYVGGGEHERAAAAAGTPPTRDPLTSAHLTTERVLQHTSLLSACAPAPQLTAMYSSTGRPALP